jgi:uncharacterized protein YpmB
MMDGDHSSRRRLILAAALSVLFLGTDLVRADGGVFGDPDDDSETVYQGLKQGRFVPLASVLAKIKLPEGSEVVNVSLEHEHNVPVYEIYYIDPGGRRRKLRFDARNGKPVKEVEE